jgi:hypothetical protein
MIRIVMYDLGMTLIDEHNRPFEHVREALKTISGFKTSDGKPLRSCLVSDFTMATPPVTAAKVRPIFKQYLDLLDQTGLRPLFEPVQRRVTLSTHANALKPDRLVFEKALTRLRVHASLEECLLITENGAHIDAARNKLHMHTLRFRSGQSHVFDFDDWSQAPALIAHLLGPAHHVNTHAALRTYLGARGVELSNVEDGDPDSFNVSAQVWSPVTVHGAAGDDVLHVAVPVRGKVTRGPNGEFHNNVPAPTEEEISEATSFVSSLATHGQIASSDGTRSSHATHDVVVDDAGRRRLVRKGFNAF